MVAPILKRSPETQSGETLLHLAVSSSSTLRSNSFVEDDSSAASSSLFPSAEVAGFILKCGADVHCRNSIAETPLHIAAKAENYSESVVKLLLDRGAHLDVPDDRRIRDGRDSPLKIRSGASA